MSENLCNLLGGGVQTIIDAVYPVGRTIICNHNPSQDYPWQTWEQDFKDRFPLGAGDTYEAGSTGGEAMHKLSVYELPNTIWNSGGGPTGGIESVFSPTATQGYGMKTLQMNMDQPHNNMPPYKAVCYWTRTA